MLPANCTGVPFFTVCGGPATTVTIGSIVTDEVATFEGHPPLALIVFVMVYGPGLLAARSISPVLVFTNTSPAGDDVKLPADPPTGNVGNGFTPPWQYGPV
jgi:hypothetical protein